jgi:hypothetical protein
LIHARTHSPVIRKKSAGRNLRFFLCVRQR